MPSGTTLPAPDLSAAHDKIEVARRAYARFGYVPIFVGRVVAGQAEPVRVPSQRRIGETSA